MNSETQERFFGAMVGMTLRTHEPLEPDIRYHLTQALGLMMSDISEGQYCAGWLNGLENILPFQLMAAKEGLDLPYHPDTLSMPTIKLMLSMAEVLGHWAKWSEWDDVLGDTLYLPHELDADAGTMSN